MKIAVIGGGINGLCCAWQLALSGHQVSLFERDALMSKTSVASSKLLHGGLRYLENFELRLVREALAERQWWLEQVSSLTRRLPILYPIYRHSAINQCSRSRWQVKIGMLLYDFLAGKKGIGRHRWLTCRQVKRCSPLLCQEDLKGAYLFHDGQMDDYALGMWVAGQCLQLSVNIFEHCEVTSVTLEGVIETKQGKVHFDRVINVAGPWSSQLLESSQISTPQNLDLVRGSHLLLPPVSKFGHLLESRHDGRVIFVLPFKGETLVGTTEVRQSLEQPITCSDEEKAYLLRIYNQYFTKPVATEQIIGTFSGVRPLLAGSESASKASREYRIIKQGHLINVFGGKWTTARALARAVVDRL